MVQMLLHQWFIMLDAQMLYATLLPRCYWALCMAQVLSCPISYNVLLTQMLLCIIYGQDVNEPFFFVDHYFIFSSGMLNNILSQVCGRLYFPIFLLSVRIVHSYIHWFFDCFWPSCCLLFSIILKFSKDDSWPLMIWWWNIGDGAFKCSLYLSPNVLPDSPMYSSPQSMLPQV